MRALQACCLGIVASHAMRRKLYGVNVAFLLGVNRHSTSIWNEPVAMKVGSSAERSGAGGVGYIVNRRAYFVALGFRCFHYMRVKLNAQLDFVDTAGWRYFFFRCR